MEEIIYHKTATFEDKHWWFIGRRRLVQEVLDGLFPSGSAQILEVGCGTGGNLSLLSRYGQVYGMELDETARQYALRRNLAPILPGCLPDDIPFHGRLFDLIVLTDVLEHVEEDELSLQRLHLRLKPGGYILITVPAFPFLWSVHDDLHHHKRRYTKSNLSAIVKRTKFDIIILSYINFFLFLPITLLRLYNRLKNIKNSDDLEMPRPWVNKFLAKLFSLERYFLKKNVSLPFGVSLLLVGRNY